jgi:DNA-binding MarR family transcriptional regulator
MARRRKKRFSKPFVMLEKETLRSKEWKELSPAEKLIYIKIKANYNGLNNGQIPFKYSEIEGEKGFKSSATISKTLKGLESKGWIEKTKHGGLYRFYCLYRLTGKFDRIRPW